jgi:amino acid transporter
MQGRFFTLITAMVVFLIVAFTPIVPVMLHYYGIQDIWVAKTCIGLITLVAGITFVKALLNREKQNKDGKFQFKLIFVIIGCAVILVSWYTILPEYLADLTGTSQFIGENNEEFLPVGIRVWTSLLTLMGVLIIKLGIERQTEVYVKEPKEKKKKKSDPSQAMQQVQAWDKEE